LQISIGKNTKITAKQFSAIAWADSWQACKDLLVAVFGRHILATHSLTGTKCNFKKDSGLAKPSLDPVSVQEMIGMLENIFHL
jgi:hypothetical protein